MCALIHKIYHAVNGLGKIPLEIEVEKMIDENKEVIETVINNQRRANKWISREICQTLDTLQKMKPNAKYQI